MTLNLALDVGGTNVRLAAVEIVKAEARQIVSQTFDWAQAGSLDRAIAQFCATQGLSPDFDKLVVAFAGLILPGQESFTLTNTPQTFTIQQLRQFGHHVWVVNDFVAQAALVRQLANDGGAGQDQLALKPGVINSAGAKAIVGPGTGLGVCAISSGGEIISGEGGMSA